MAQEICAAVTIGLCIGLWDSVASAFRHRSATPMMDEHSRDGYFGFDPDVVLVHFCLSAMEKCAYIGHGTHTTASAKRSSDATNSQYLLQDLTSADVEPLTFWILHFNPVVTDSFYWPPGRPLGMHGEKEPLGEYILHWAGDNLSRPNVVARCNGKPHIDVVMRFIQVSILNAGNGVPLGRRLPEYMIVTFEFTSYMQTLRPFLNSLPAPFAWHLEPPGLAQLLFGETDGDRFRSFVQGGITENTAGNEAHGMGDRRRALVAYTKAIRYIGKAVKLKLDDIEKEVARKLLPVFLANRAITLLAGSGRRDARQALVDGRVGEYLLPNYWKIYYCQWKAYSMLGYYYDAAAVVDRAIVNLHMRTRDELGWW
ncbi:hypothetical protein BV25DRAFT_1837421 [Artomyces pyxidatus]|uniref:Uncharacterized protein n=1 Tax=Artomyces pyxidatus TaxID=48021 RepID=A0ACB8T5X5_9AGAM|nr:hypothetical protein BV25DRAFT_1837421 [Artomyces pyxidatus]